VNDPTVTRRRFRCVHCGGEVPLAEPADSASRCTGCGAHFSINDGIVALGGVDDDRDYPAPLIDLIADVEQRHFWFEARNDVILSTIRRVIGPAAGVRVLDIGCGTGFVTGALEMAGMDMWGIDMHRLALTYARSRVHGPLFLNDATTLPFFRDFAVASLFDVIEHLDDDVGAIRQAASILQPNGSLVVTVPAGPSLWSKYDEVIGHKRRYDRRGLAQVLTEAGLVPAYLGYFNCLPLLAQVVQRWITPGLRASSNDDMIDIVRRTLAIPPGLVNSLFRWSIRVEAPLRHVSWVRGGSLIAVARRPD